MRIPFKISFLFILWSFGLSILAEEGVEQLEDKLLKLLPSLKPIEKCRLYQIGARELFLFDHLSKSKHYYEQSLKENCAEGRLEALINIVTISKMLKLKEDLSSYKEKILKDKAANDPVIKEYLKTLEGKGKLTGYFGALNKDKSIESAMKKGEYKSALLMLNPKVVRKADINKKLQYDVLRTLVLKGTAENLFCEKELKKYKTSLSYTMELCRYLLKRNKKEKTGPSLKSLKEKVKRERMASLYLIEALEGSP
ncbi:MAG: hypothetical protein VXV96_07795 [Bdellovibrionota bacterium]|nr:hypothetical protein [Bdellovibrionota bacterium]